jgi:hypothetical protein
MPHPREVSLLQGKGGTMRAWLTTSCRPVPTATPRTNCRRRTGPDRGTGQPTARIVPARSTATPSAVRSPTPLLRPGRAATARPPWTGSTRRPRCRTHQGPTSAVRCRNSRTCQSPRTGQPQTSPRNHRRLRRTRVAEYAEYPRRPDRRPTHPSTASLRGVPSTASRRRDSTASRHRDGSMASRHRDRSTAIHRRVPSTTNRPNTMRRRSRIRIPVPSGGSPMRPNRALSDASPMHPNRVPSGPTPTPTGKTPIRSATTQTHSAGARTGLDNPAAVDPPLRVRHRKARHRLDPGRTGQVRMRRDRADTALEASPRLSTVLAVSPSRTRSRAVPAPMAQAAPDQLATDPAATELAATELDRVGVAGTDLQATATDPTAS